MLLGRKPFMWAIVVGKYQEGEAGGVLRDNAGSHT